MHRVFFGINIFSWICNNFNEEDSERLVNLLNMLLYVSIGVLVYHVLLSLSWHHVSVFLVNVAFSGQIILFINMSSYLKLKKAELNFGTIS